METEDPGHLRIFLQNVVANKRIPLNETMYRKIISGDRKDWGAGAIRVLLRILSGFYSLVIRLRNCFYDWNMLPVHDVPAVVISIGNLTTGGTFMRWCTKTT